MNDTTSASPESSRATPQIDIYAASLAGLCLIHCLALPVLVAFLPVVLVLSEAEWIHQLIVVLAAPATLWVISTARPGLWFVVAALTGITFLFAGAFAETLHEVETPLTVAGSVLLASAHLWHWYHNRVGGGRRNTRSENERLPLSR